MRYVYAIIATPTPVRFEVTGVDPGGAVTAVCHHGLGAVVSPTKCVDFRGVTRQQALPALVAHQRVVETVMERFSVLPAKFGTVLPTARRVRDLLDQGYPALRSALDTVAGTAQFEVVVTWDLAAVFREIAAEADIAAARADARRRPPEEAAAASVAVGQMVKASLERRRAALLAQLVPRLREGARDYAINPTLDDHIVANLALLLDRAGLATLDHRLAALDQQFNKQLHFRCVGPLPPYSFATVEIWAPQFTVIDAARRRLGLEEASTVQDISRTYRRLAAQVHPDVNPNGEAAQTGMAELTESFRLLSALARAQLGGRPGDAASVCRFDEPSVTASLLVSVVRSRIDEEAVHAIGDAAS